MDSAELLDGDRLSQLLFDAGETLGAADPFLARELADGVLHFLRREFEDQPPTPAEVVDATVKVVAELGHPRLARAIPGVAATLDEPIPEPAPPPDADSPRLRDWARANVFPGLVAAALDRRLIHLDDHAVPDRLMGGLVELPVGECGRPLFEALEAARERFSRFIVIDRAEAVAAGSAAEWGRSLALGLRLTGLRASLVVNRRAESGDSSGLFSDDDQPTGAARLLRELPDEPRIEAVVRVGRQDFSGPGREELAQTCAAAVARGATFAIDRPRSGTGLVPGIAAGCPALLTAIDLDLGSLLEALHPRPSAAEFVAKLGSLARLALSAGHAWQRAMRRFARPTIQAGFLLERAGLAVRPIQFARVLDDLLPDADPSSRRDFVRSAWRQLRSAVADDGLTATLTGDPWTGVADAIDPSHWHHLDGATITLPTTSSADALLARLESCYRDGGATWLASAPGS